MIDRLFANRHPLRDVFTEEYNPKQAVAGSQLVNAEGNNLHVLFPPWHGGGKFYEKLIARLAARNSAVLAYYFHDEILRPNAHDTRDSFRQIRDTVTNDMLTITNRRDYENIRLIGMSLGNPALAMATSSFEGFDGATLIAAASSLARSMWHGIRTRHVRAGIEQAGHNLSDLESLWSELAPVSHLGSLVGKDVDLIIPSSDRIIPTEYQMEYLDAAQDLGISPNTTISRLGHYTTIAKFCLVGET